MCAFVGGEKKRKKTPSVVLRSAETSEVVGGPPPAGKAWTSSADGELVRGRSSEGAASWPSETVPYLIERLSRNETIALAWEELDGATTPVYTSWTWREYVAEVRRAAAAMVKLGLASRQTVAIMGFNSKEWLVADLAAILAGGFATGIYATNGVDSVRYILEHSRSAIAVVEGAKQAAKVEQALRKDPFWLKAVIAYGADASPFSHTLLTVRCLRWEEFITVGGCTETVSLEASRQRPGQTCTLIYTSGTTGAPKAVAISHDNITWIVRSFACTVGFGHAGAERLVSYLPLSHIAAQAIDIYANLCTVGRKVGDDEFGCRVEAATVYFARPDALKGSLKLTLCAVRPTVFFGVPRVFEKFAEALQAVGAKSKGLKKHLATWAKSVMLDDYCRRRADNRAAGERFEGIVTPINRAVQRTLAMLLLKKVHAAIGLDQCHFCFTGAAPIAVATLEYFGSLGLTVNEAFGMSEVSGPASVTLDDYFVPGTTGPACPGVEIKLEHVAGRDKDGEGELLIRGRSVMLGYLRNDEKTRETIDAQGFVHTGDMAKLVEPFPGASPMLKITGRIKELIITAGGENVAPVPIEDAVKTNLKGAVSNVVVVGDRLKFLSALFTLHHAPKGEVFTEELTGGSKDVDPSCLTANDAAKSSTWANVIQAAIDKYNDDVAVSAAQKLHKFAILPSDFAQATGELTPTLKLKRAFIVEKYAHVIKAIYGANPSAVWG